MTERQSCSERPQSYIGVSGLVSPFQQGYLWNEFHRAALPLFPYDRLLALGVKAVHKTQFLDVENKHGRIWYPVGEEGFAGALVATDTKELRVAQVYFDADRVHDEKYRDKFVERIRQRGEAWLSALQFDLLPWHEDKSILPWIKKVKEESDLKILLQAHGEAMEQLGPEGVVGKLGRYASALDYVLFDASHGKGVRMNSEALKPFLYEAYNSEELSEAGFSVAGGLSADVVREELSVLVRDYPGLSWDAEGQLHPVQADNRRPLDLYLSADYLKACEGVLREKYSINYEEYKRKA